VIQAFFDAVGHRKVEVQTGGLVPMIVSVSRNLLIGQVKAVAHPEATMPVIVGGQSITAPRCQATAR
jgi:hypothetical protein